MSTRTSDVTTLADQVRAIVHEELEALINIRHDLHAHPELGYEETRTSGVVQRELDAAGVSFQPGLAGGTGVLASLPGGAERAVGLRADMDALPIEEETTLPYRSTHPGKMHACGHDGHTTILIGAARVLARIAERETLPQPVTLVFQPAEEGGAGGRRMVEDGCLTGDVLGPPVRTMFGLHGWPQMELGKIGTRPGPMLAAADKFEITIRGKGCHAAFPHTGHDPIVASASLVQALQTIVARNIDPLESVVVSITQIHAGTTHNIIPEAVTLAGTVRTLTDEGKATAVKRLEEVSQQIARAFNCTATLDYTDGYPVTKNDPDAVHVFERIAADAVGPAGLDSLDAPVMGGEDFSFYCHQVPSCFFALGLTPDVSREIPNLHHPKFDFNDDALALGVEMFCRLALCA